MSPRSRRHPPRWGCRDRPPRHEFRHVAQYEAKGGIAGFLAEHLQHLVRFGYEESPFERDARAHEADRFEP